MRIDYIVQWGASGGETTIFVETQERLRYLPATLGGYRRNALRSREGGIL
jgi:hypothetical protein